jgi:hypothetical protein
MVIAHLVAPKIDQATVDVLTLLLDRALTGEIVGIAYVVLHAGTDFSADVVGSCTDHPLLCRGIASTLADTVAEFCKK